MRTAKKKKGFTLIELIVIMAVLSILAAIAVPSYWAVLDASRKSAFISDLNNMEKIINVYALTRNAPPSRFPEEAFAEINNPGQMTDAQWNEYARNHLDGFITGGWPVSTPWGGFYTYRAYERNPGNWIENWRRIEGEGNITEITDNEPFEIIMIRFENPRDNEGFEKALAAIKDSRFAKKAYRYGDQNNIGIIVTLIDD